MLMQCILNKENDNYKKIINYFKSNQKYSLNSNKNTNLDEIELNYKIINDDINSLNHDLVIFLLQNKLCEELFFEKIGEVHILNQNKLIDILFKTNEYME